MSTQETVPGTIIYKNVNYGFNTTLATLKKFESFDFLDSDILLASYPKTGTTLCQEIVFNIMNRDIIHSPKIVSPSYDTFPFIELDPRPPHPITRLSPEEQAKHPAMKSPFLYLEELKQQGLAHRLIKTHCGVEFLKGTKLVSSKTKIVFVARNPLDTCVSFYHFNKSINGFDGNFEEFAIQFLNGQVLYGNFFEYLNNLARELGINGNNDPTQPLHIKQSSSCKFNCFFITYESLVKTPYKIIKELSEFLIDPKDGPLTEEELQTIVQKTKFEEMKKNDHRTKFIKMKDNAQFFRKGKVGDWKDSLSEGTSQEYLKKIKNDLLINFEYE